MRTLTVGLGFALGDSKRGFRLRATISEDAGSALMASSSRLANASRWTASTATRSAVLSNQCGLHVGLKANAHILFKRTHQRIETNLHVLLGIPHLRLKAKLHLAHHNLKHGLHMFSIHWRRRLLKHNGPRYRG